MHEISATQHNTTHQTWTHLIGYNWLITIKTSSHLDTANDYNQTNIWSNSDLVDILCDPSCLLKLAEFSMQFNCPIKWIAKNVNSQNICIKKVCMNCKLGNLIGTVIFMYNLTTRRKVCKPSWLFGRFNTHEDHQTK